MTNDELIVFMKDHTNAEAAEHFGVCVKTICRKLNKLGFRYEDLKHGDCPKVLSKLQDDLMTACLLGDGSVEKQGRFRLKMKCGSMEYVDYVRNIILPFSRRMQIEINKPMIICGRHTVPENAAFFCTITHSIFKELRNKWYPNNKKIIPSGLVLNPTILAHWFLQDGCNCHWKKSVTISTQFFTDIEVELLSSYLNDHIGIKSTVQYSQGPIINIGARQYIDFMNTVAPHCNFKCFSYKTDTSLAPMTKVGYGAGKLNKKQACEIRKLYYSGKYTQKYLANQYGVTQTLVSRIVHNVVHKDLIYGD